MNRGTNAAPTRPRLLGGSTLSSDLLEPPQSRFHVYDLGFGRRPGLRALLSTGREDGPNWP